MATRTRKKPISRQDRAKQTRARICDAAAELFAERGYAATTMDAVAQRAGVAVQTVYFVFRTKGLLFLDVLVRMAHGPEVTAAAEKGPPAFLRGALGERDPQALLARLVEGAIDFNARFASLWPYVQQAAAGDDEFQARFDAIVQQRRRGMQQVFAALDAQGALRVPATEAAETFFLLVNPELLALATRALGWSLERYAAWAWLLTVQQSLREGAPRQAAARGTRFAALVGKAEDR